MYYLYIRVLRKLVLRYYLVEFINFLVLIEKRKIYFFIIIKVELRVGFSYCNLFYFF